MPLSRLSVLKQSLFFEKICCCLQSFDAAMRGFSLASALPPLHPFPPVVLLTAKPRSSPMAARKPLREQFLNKVYLRTGVLPGGATAPPSSRRDLFRPSAILPAAKSAGLERPTAVRFPFGKALHRFFSLQNALRF